MIVVAPDRALPLRAPRRRAGRHRPESDRPSGRSRGRNAAAADESFLAMVEAPGVEVVDHRAQRARAHERIHPRALIEEHCGAAADLIGIVAANDALAGHRVVGPADARPQHQMDIAERIGGKDHEAARLLEFPSARVDIGYTLGALPCSIEVYLEHPRVGSYLDVGFFRSERNDREMRARLGVCLAAKAFAVAAVVART